MKPAEKPQKRRKGLSIMSHLFCFLASRTHIFISSQASQITKQLWLQLAPCQSQRCQLVADPEAIGRAHSHNTVTFHEWLVVTHDSGLYIPHLSECKVRLAIFIERNRRGWRMWDSAHLYAPLHLRCSVRIINLSLETFSFAVLTQINDKY